MKKQYNFLQLIGAVACGVVLTSSSALAQCSVNAGEDTTICSGPLGLAAIYNPVQVPVLDIDQDENNTCMAFFNQGGLAQQFTTFETSSCGAGLTFVSAATGTLTISLWDNLPNAGGVQLASGSVTLSGETEGDVSWSSVNLVMGNYYYLVFESADISTCIAGSTLNPYADGVLYANSGYQAFTSYDYTFRTFSCGTPTGPVLEIDQSVNNTCMAFFNQSSIAQQFTATNNSSCGAGVTFTDLANGTLTISLWDNLPNAGGVQLASSSTTVVNSNVGDVEWSSVTLTPGNFYYLVFESADITSCIAGTLNNDYAGGVLYANAGYVAYPSYDYTFRTYSCETPVYNISWTGAGIVSGDDTFYPIVNPPAGATDYEITVTETVTGCTSTDIITVTNLDYTVSIIDNGNGTLTASSGVSHQWVTCPSLAPIIGADDQLFTPTANGEYAVIATDAGGCEATSTCFTVNNLNVEEQSTELVSIYPNPTEDRVVIEFEAEEAQIEIRDAQGKLIESRKRISGEEISLKRERNGVYFITITTETSSTVHRVVKQ